MFDNFKGSDHVEWTVQRMQLLAVPLNVPDLGWLYWARANSRASFEK